ncbi:hypothetical protein R1sor_021576 [Riccia sorocarpa]|uniref:TEP-1 C-terminal beta-propeller domain-containing protein n=1 Tax=Riccia sorocarpa TaxID=122646 RepID=A0ABD3GKK5_9MARC
MGPVWDSHAADIVPASQSVDDHSLKFTARVPSLFQSLLHRQIRASRVRQLPYEGEWSSDGEKKGGGVLTVQNQSYRAPPLSLSFAKKRLDGQMLAVADEEGYVSVFNTDRHLPSMADCYSKTRNVRSKLWMAHTNAVFDVCWTKDDTHILTASGDQTIRLWDIENKKGVGVMMGHSGSVKSICVHPSQSDTLVSGSRDGCVFFWDLRVQSGSLAGCPKNTAVNKIKDAHKGLLNAKRRKGYTRSVTSVIYLKDERLVATAGANDGVVKFWDTRKLKTPVAHTSSSRIAPGARMHGIAGLSQDPTGTRLIATSVDSKIYMYDVMALGKGELKTFTGHTMGSFYIKASFSPDGSHILGGSTDYNAYLWKVDRPQDPPVLLRGHSGEVTAVDWCPMEHCKVATCSDDYTVRVWTMKSPRFSERPQPKPSESTVERPEVEAAPLYTFLDLRLEDSQHHLQANLLHRGKKLVEAHADTDLNTLRLVEDSQHALPASQLRSLREDSEPLDDNPVSGTPNSSESFSEDEKLDEGGCGSAAPSSTSGDSAVRSGAGTVLHPKRTRVLFHDEFVRNKEETPAKDLSRKESPENAVAEKHAKIDTNLKDEQVSPPFKRTRIPLRELNSDGFGNTESECSTAPAAGLPCGILPDSTIMDSPMEQNRPPTDKHSTPSFKDLKGYSGLSTLGGELHCGKVESPEGYLGGSPSSVLSPPSSTQRRRKTIMDYFSLQPQLLDLTCTNTNGGSSTK